MRFHSEDVLLIRTLFQTRGSIQVLWFNTHYRLSPGQVSRAIERLLREDAVEIDERTRTINMTESGRRWVMDNRKVIFGKRPLYWKRTQNKAYNRIKLNPKDLYVPNSKLYRHLA